jgi:cutinase
MKPVQLSLLLLLTLPFLANSFPTPFIVTRQSTSVENGLKTDACKALTVIYARGTNEPGNVGAVAGPPFTDALRKALGADQVTIQGVDYPATWDGYVIL